MNKPASIHHNFEFLNTEVEKWYTQYFSKFHLFQKIATSNYTVLEYYKSINI